MSSGCRTYGTIFSGTVGAHDVRPAKASDADTSEINSRRSNQASRSETADGNSSLSDFWNSSKFEYSSSVRQNCSVFIDDTQSSSSTCLEQRCFCRTSVYSVPDDDGTAGTTP